MWLTLINYILCLINLPQFNGIANFYANKVSLTENCSGGLVSLTCNLQYNVWIIHINAQYIWLNWWDEVIRCKIIHALKEISGGWNLFSNESFNFVFIFMSKSHLHGIFNMRKYDFFKNKFGGILWTHLATAVWMMLFENFLNNIELTHSTDETIFLQIFCNYANTLNLSGFRDKSTSRS